jgi:hypothetical protein
MEKAGAALTELQFTILDGMADDYEDAEQLYIYANRKLREEQQIAIDSPNMLLCVRFPLRELIDEVGNMLRDGWDFSAKQRKEGSPVSFRGMETQICRKKPDSCCLVHVHCSALPGNSEAATE